MMVSITCVTVCNAQQATPQPPYADIVLDYARPFTIQDGGSTSKAYLFNVGCDIYNYRGNSPIGLVLGARMGFLKNDGTYVRQASQQIWGTKLQAAFVAGARIYRMAGKRVLEAGIVAGPVHLANIEIGSFDKPLTSILSEASVYISPFVGVYIGAKFIYYPVFYDYKLQPIGGSALSAIGLSMRVAI
ncbi:hypothetical protein CAP35_13265 [Chitinophagaceae bacterium IBVUCB1]|nr:hypothetical protein CAP35_13265 [Chitinophagaceae bacterium IBVUCB1]